MVPFLLKSIRFNMNFKSILFNVSWTPCQLKKNRHIFTKKRRKLVIHPTITRIAKKWPSILIRNIIITVPSRVNPLWKLSWVHKYALFPFHPDYRRIRLFSQLCCFEEFYCCTFKDNCSSSISALSSLMFSGLSLM